MVKKIVKKKGSQLNAVIHYIYIYTVCYILFKVLKIYISNILKYLFLYYIPQSVNQIYSVEQTCQTVK